MLQIIEFSTSTENFIKATFNNSWLWVVLSSFMGAFFAFLFIKLSDVLTRISKRKKINYNTLVQLEYVGNENLSIASDIIFIAKDITKTAEKTLAGNNILINFNIFDKLIVKNDLLIDLLNIDFINQCVSLNTHARKINHSLETINKYYNQINDGIFQKTFPKEGYKENLKGIINNLQHITKFLEDFIEENIMMMATAEVLMEVEKPSFTKLASFIFKSRSLANFRDEIEVKRKELESQIIEISQKDKQRIEKIIDKNTDDAIKC